MVKTWLTAHNEIQCSLSRADRAIIVCTDQTANTYVRYSSKTVRLPVIGHCSVKPAKLKPWVETVANFDASDGALPDGFRRKVEYGPELHESDLSESVQVLVPGRPFKNLPNWGPPFLLVACDFLIFGYTCYSK